MAEAITRDEFEAVRTGTTALSPESRRMLELTKNTGMKVTCRWKHHGANMRVCRGAIMMHKRAKGHSRVISTSCRDKVLYVFRYA